MSAFLIALAIASAFANPVEEELLRRPNSITSQVPGCTKSGCNPNSFITGVTTGFYLDISQPNDSYATFLVRCPLDCKGKSVGYLQIVASSVSATPPYSEKVVEVITIGEKYSQIQVDKGDLVLRGNGVKCIPLVPDNMFFKLRN